MSTEENNSNSELEIEENEESNETDSVTKTKTSSKPPKNGIVYLSTIPPYMDVTRVREYFDKFGTVKRIYLQLGDQKKKGTEKKSKKKNARKYIEGWVEFERKHIAKKVAQLLTNTRVSERKGSKLYDHVWNIKYLRKFKWTHLHERLAYEKAARRQKLRAEIQLAKKKGLSFSSNLDKKKKNKEVVNKEYENLAQDTNSMKNIEGIMDSKNDRKEFLTSLF